MRGQSIPSCDLEETLLSPPEKKESLSSFVPCHTLATPLIKEVQFLTTPKEMKEAIKAGPGSFLLPSDDTRNMFT